MCTRILRLPVALALLVVGFLLVAPAANAGGWQKCGANQVSSWSGYYKNLQKFKVVGKAAKINQSAGYRPVDGSFNDWGKKRVIVAPLAKKAVIDNYGCKSGQIGSVDKKTLSKGWKVLFALPDKYDKSDIKVSKPKGKDAANWKKTTLKGRLVGQATCSNPGKALVEVVVWIKKSAGKKPTGDKPCDCPPPKAEPEPKPAPGCTNGQNGTTASGAACQGNGSSETAEVDTTQTGKQECEAKGGIWTNSSVCTIINNNTTIINQTTIQVNANCSKVVITYGNGSTTTQWHDATGNLVTENYCSTVTPPSSTPPPVNRVPKVEIYNPAKHVCSRETTTGGFLGSAGYVTLKITASDPDGDNLGTPTVRAQYGTVGLPQKIAEGQWTVKYTGPKMSGTDTFWATVSDGEADPVTASIPILNPKVDLDNPSPTTC